MGLERYNKDKNIPTFEKWGCILQDMLETWGMSQVQLKTRGLIGQK